MVRISFRPRKVFGRLPCRRMTTISKNLIHVEKSVQEALANGEPVVALESTIIAHGMPYPQNLELAQELESILRNKGVTPATIAIKDGFCRVGLSKDELEDLAVSGEENRAKKCSTRDLPVLIAKHRASESKDQWGATTVASSMRLAHLAGIETFVTGGIGGVHRDGQNTMDVSADLTELAHTPVVVVSAGVKSILDIERTLEVLETNGVPVYGWQTDEFPAFFSPESGVPCPFRAESATEIAEAYSLSRALNLPNGFLIGVPNNDAAGGNVEVAIQSALAEAEKLGIRGQDTTPFILKYVAEKTEGDSLRSNIALVKQNAKVGASIAAAIASSKSAPSARSTSPSSDPNSTSGSKPKSNKTALKNLAILKNSSELRMSPLSPTQPARHEVLDHASILVIDGGRDVHEHINIAKLAAEKGLGVMFIPSGINCSVTASREDKFLPCVKYLVADVEDILAINDGWTDSLEDIALALVESDLATVKESVKRVIQKMNQNEAHVLVTLENKGLLLGSRFIHEKVIFNEFPEKEGIEIQKGTAASDCLLGAFVHGLLNQHDPTSAARDGFNAVDALLSSGLSQYPFLSQYEAKH